MKRHARLRQLRKADGHVDVRGRKVRPPAAAVAITVVDQSAEVEPSIEIVLAGDALTERQRTLKLCGTHAAGSYQHCENDSKDHVFKNVCSSASTWFQTGSSSCRLWPP